MTEDRVREIVFDMENPLLNLSGVEALLYKLVESCSVMNQEQAVIYALIARNLARERAEIDKLWSELFKLTVEPEKKPPLKAA